jgi:ABC-2 type transport system permease protein
VTTSTSTDGQRFPLLRHEWRLLVRTWAPWLVAMLFLLTSAAGLVNGMAAVQRHRLAADDAVAAQTAQYEALKQDLTRIEQQRAREGVPLTRLLPGLPSAGAAESRVSSYRVALPPLSTAIIGPAALERVPQRYEVRGGGGARFWPFGRTVGTRIVSGLTPEQPLDNPATTVLGSVDLAFVIVYLSPLLIVALMYDVVTRERESGTLALVAAQPITMRRWLAVRVAVRGLVLSVFGVLIPAAIAAAAVLAWSSDTVIRLFVWTGGVLAYSAIWAFVTTLVSLHARSSALAAIVAVSAWLVFVIVVPSLLQLAAPLLSPTSAHLSYVTEERAASLAVNARVDSAVAALNQLVRVRFSGLASSGTDHPTFTEAVDPPVERELLRFPQSPWTPPTSVVRLNRAFGDARRAHVEEKLAPVLAQLDANEWREAEFFAIAKYLSPALVLRGLADDLAGTGQHRWQAFLGQLDEYVRQRDAYFSQKVLGAANVPAHDVGEALMLFRYREESLSTMMSRAAFPLASLAVIAAGLGYCVMRSSRRCPP